MDSIDFKVYELGQFITLSIHLCNANKAASRLSTIAAIAIYITVMCLQCFDTVGWASERASGL